MTALGPPRKGRLEMAETMVSRPCWLKNKKPSARRHSKDFPSREKGFTSQHACYRVDILHNRHNLALHHDGTDEFDSSHGHLVTWP